jgi:predicted GNAT superfamily acetyltransferase
MTSTFPHRTDPDGLTFRPLASVADFEACIEIQRQTWGRDFSDVVPLSILKIAQKTGGIVAGAFTVDGRMLGYVFGLTGVRSDRGDRGDRDSQPFHWSHMLAVTPAGRDLGLGTRLKLYQRECLLGLGIEEVQWTYDPLESRNAHLNFNHLGVGVAEYVENMYEGEMGSELAQGIGSDRFIVSWRIASERVALALRDKRAGSAEPFREAPVVNPDGVIEMGELPAASRVRVEIPENIQAVKAERPEAATAWRESTRHAFETYLARGHRVEAFYRDRAAGRCYYGLESQ